MFAPGRPGAFSGQFGAHAAAALRGRMPVHFKMQMPAAAFGRRALQLQAAPPQPPAWVVSPAYEEPADGSVPVALTRACAEAAAASIEQHGLVVLPALYRGTALSSLRRKLCERADGIMAELQARGEKQGLRVGSVHGFHEVCLRSPGRYDLTASFGDFSAAELQPLEAIVQDARLLAEECDEAFCGVVLSEPSSPAQEWHADSLHLTDAVSPPNLINGLLALHDCPLSMGPTEFVPGSHQLTNHFSNPAVPGIDLVYQKGRVEPQVSPLQSHRTARAPPGGVRATAGWCSC